MSGKRALKRSDSSPLLIRLPGVNAVRPICSDHWAVGGDDLHIQAVHQPEFVGLRDGGAGHPADHGIQRDQVLERDGSENSALGLQRQAFLGFNGRVQSGRPAPVFSDAPFELVDGFDGAVFDQVIHVPAKQLMGMQRILNGGEEREVLLGE
jgi:hypothetical protein